jgi:hypothetical protein
MFYSGSKEKTVEYEAVTRTMEVDDDDMTKDCNNGLMIIRKG